MSDQLTFAVVTALVLAAVICLVVRRRLITRRGGVVECGLRQGLQAPWRHGLAQYQRGRLCWYRSLSLRPRPDACFDRAELAIVRSRQPSPAEAARLGLGILIAECETRPARVTGSEGVLKVELAMSEAALTGLLSWLEASPQFHLRAS